MWKQNLWNKEYAELENVADEKIKSQDSIFDWFSFFSFVFFLVLLKLSDYFIS